MANTLTEALTGFCLRTSGLTTGSPLNHGTPSVAIGLIIDGKDVGCGGQREAGSLMLGRS